MLQQLWTCFWHPSIFRSRFMQSKIIKSPYPAIFFRDPILILHRFRKVPVFTVHKKKRKRRFQNNSTLESDFRKLRFRRPFSSETCGWRAYPHGESRIFKRKRIHVDGASVAPLFTCARFKSRYLSFFFNQDPGN